jgi:hypothetical protein
MSTEAVALNLVEWAVETPYKRASSQLTGHKGTDFICKIQKKV